MKNKKAKDYFENVADTSNEWESFKSGIEFAEMRIKILINALEFYADLRMWERCNQTHYTNLNRDKDKFGMMNYGGSKAREALAKYKGEV